MLIILNYLTMKKFLSILLVLSLVSSISLVAQNQQSLDEQLRNIVKSEPFNISMMFQSTFRYSFDDDDFLGGRTFQIPQGRLDFRGNLDGGYFYRLYVNMVTEPNLLDAYVGYKHSDQLIFTLGRQKPMQSPDFIPGPQALDFMSRARITRFLVQFREFGLSVHGTNGDFYYSAGVFNGTSSSNNIGNEFYGIGRLQYTLQDIGAGFLRVGLHGSYGSGTTTRPAPFGGTMFVSDRSVIGFDALYQTSKWKFKGEYMHGEFDDTFVPNFGSTRDETISGYYLDGIYSASEQLKFVGRFQQWKREEPRELNYQSTLGILYEATSIVSFRVNLDVYNQVGGDAQAGVGAMMQVYF